MPSAVSPKPLNPNAESWFPEVQKHSSTPEEAPEAEQCSLLLLPRQISTTSPPPEKLTPEMFSLFFTNQIFHAALSQYTVSYPDYFFYEYPWFQVYYQPTVSNRGVLMVESENDVMKKKLMGGSEELKGLFSEVLEQPKDAVRFVPARLGRGYFEEFRGKKKLPRNLRKPKVSDFGDGRIKKFVPSASHQNEEFNFCNYTTVMMKNIPNQHRRDSFMKFLDKCSCEHLLEYDFLYLPIDFKTGANLGYAFVNFTSTCAAKKMKEAFQGYRWGVIQTSEGTYTSKKILEITWARIQIQPCCKSTTTVGGNVESKFKIV